MELSITHWWIFPIKKVLKTGILIILKTSFFRSYRVIPSKKFQSHLIPLVVSTNQKLRKNNPKRHVNHHRNERWQLPGCHSRPFWSAPRNTPQQDIHSAKQPMATFLAHWTVANFLEKPSSMMKNDNHMPTEIWRCRTVEAWKIAI